MLDPIVETFDGIILANTTQKREQLHSDNQHETGGLSGRPLFERNLELISYAYKQTNGQFLIIGKQYVTERRTIKCIALPRVSSRSGKS